MTRSIEARISIRDPGYFKGCFCSGSSCIPNCDGKRLMLPNTRKLPTKYDIIQEYGGSRNVAHAFGEHADADGYANGNAIVDSILEQDVRQWQEEQEQAYRFVCTHYKYTRPYPTRLTVLKKSYGSRNQFQREMGLDPKVRGHRRRRVVRAGGRALDNHILAYERKVWENEQIDAKRALFHQFLRNDEAMVARRQQAAIRKSERMADGDVIGLNALEYL